MTTNRNLATTSQTHVAPGWSRTIDDAGRAQYLPAVQPQRRQMPMLALVALLALAGALVAWGVAGTVPSVLTFLVVMATLGGGLYWFESRTEYQHSRGGIERLRITESANLEMAKIDGEIELRRLALDAYIRMMERDND